MKKKIIKFSTLVLSLFLLTIVVLSGFFFLTSYKPTTYAEDNLISSKLVTVDTSSKNYLSFTPKNMVSNTGLIIYPGAKVEPEAYATLANEIAQAGYVVFIVPMPVNFAIFDSNAAEKVIEDFSSIKNWAIAGHSLGGVMAAKYASTNHIIKGMAFYASYPQGDELKNSTIEVTSIYASEDGVADMNKILDSKNNLPSNTKFIEIIGGNHGQFGSYGEQSGDNPAKISNEEQIKQVAESTIEMLKKISSN